MGCLFIFFQTKLLNVGEGHSFPYLRLLLELFMISLQMFALDVKALHMYFFTLESIYSVYRSMYDGTSRDTLTSDVMVKFKYNRV